MRNDVVVSRLLSIWDARDAEHKFMVVCMVHNVDDIGWHRNLPPWTRRNAIRFITLSEQCVSTSHVAFIS
jgi:hypothetical protein